MSFLDQCRGPEFRLPGPKSISAKRTAGGLTNRHRLINSSLLSNHRANGDKSRATHRLLAKTRVSRFGNSVENLSMAAPALPQTEVDADFDTFSRIRLFIAFRAKKAASSEFDPRPADLL